VLLGGGNVGLEKTVLLKSSPNANVEVVAPRFLPELELLAAKHHSVKLTAKNSIAGCCKRHGNCLHR
jgi:precorrin-2 dehydrogenase/sirohydrochlorin ferrochelatase